MNRVGKSLFILLSVILSLGVVNVASAQDRTLDWENPEIISKNKENSYATHISFKSREAALANDFSSK